MNLFRRLEIAIAIWEAEHLEWGWMYANSVGVWSDGGMDWTPVEKMGNRDLIALYIVFEHYRKAGLPEIYPHKKLMVRARKELIRREMPMEILDNAS